MGILTKNFMSLLKMECEIFITLFIKALGIESLVWQKALSLEIFRSICRDFNLLKSLFTSYDMEQQASNVFHDMLREFLKVLKSEPVELSANNALKVQCIDQLDKMEPPLIPEKYICDLAFQCVSYIIDGMSMELFPLFLVNDDMLNPFESELSFRMAINGKFNNYDGIEGQNIRKMLQTVWKLLLNSLLVIISSKFEEDYKRLIFGNVQKYLLSLLFLKFHEEKDISFAEILCFARPIPSGSKINEGDASPSATFYTLSFPEKNVALFQSLLQILHCCPELIGKSLFSFVEALFMFDQYAYFQSAQKKAGIINQIGEADAQIYHISWKFILHEAALFSDSTFIEFCRCISRLPKDQIIVVCTL